MDYKAPEGYSGIKLCPHYKLKFVSLKPKLIDDLGMLNLTFENPIDRYWDQDEPGKSLSKVHLDFESSPMVKVLEIPLSEIAIDIPGFNPSLRPCTLIPEYGIIAFDSYFIGYLLRKEDSLSLERMVLELERSQCISPFFMTWMEKKHMLPIAFTGNLADLYEKYS